MIRLDLYMSCPVIELTGLGTDMPINHPVSYITQSTNGLPGLAGKQNAHLFITSRYYCCVNNGRPKSQD